MDHFREIDGVGSSSSSSSNLIPHSVHFVAPATVGKGGPDRLSEDEPVQDIVNAVQGVLRNELTYPVSTYVGRDDATEAELVAAVVDKVGTTPTTMANLVTAVRRILGQMLSSGGAMML